MVERYTRLVVDQGVSPDAVLAFTFTDKAAAELRARVRAELSRRAAGTGAAAVRAAGLLSTMGGAWITTIHGFCNRVLAAHPVAAGVDPGFRVLDQPEAERAAREAFDAALTEFLAGADPAREETVAAYDLEGLRGVVVATHDELRSRGIAEPALPDPPTGRPRRGDRHRDRGRRRMPRGAEGGRRQTPAARGGDRPPHRSPARRRR